MLHTAAQETLLSTVATMIAGIFQLISRCVAVFAEGLSVDVFEDTTGDDEDNFDCANYVINLICKGGGPEEVKEGCARTCYTTVLSYSSCTQPLLLNYTLVYIKPRLIAHAVLSEIMLPHRITKSTPDQ